jgi:hypothetical protein
LASGRYFRSHAYRADRLCYSNVTDFFYAIASGFHDNAGLTATDPSKKQEIAIELALLDQRISMRLESVRATVSL